MLDLVSFRRQCASELSLMRRRAGEASLDAFMHLYMGRHLTVESSSMHREIAGILNTTPTRRGMRLAWASPRGYGKSMLVTLSYVLWCVLYQRERFIVLLSNTTDQVFDRLSEIKLELQDNPLIIEDFPEVAQSFEFSPPAPRWKKDQVVTRTGIKVIALGAGQRLRGRKNRDERPTLIIADDVENDTHVKSPDQRDALSNWFFKAVCQSGTVNTNIIVIGTILNHDSLLAKLTDPKQTFGWECWRYKAVESWAERQDLWQRWQSIYNRLEEDENGRSGPEAARGYFASNRELMLQGTKVLWPQWESYDQLMELRISLGPMSFDSEKQNEPTDPTKCLIRPEDIAFWSDHFQSEQELIKSLHRAWFYCAVDPSMGKHGRGRDPSAIIVIVHDPTLDYSYVLIADIQYRLPSDIIETVIKYCKMFDMRRVAIEATQFQEYLADNLRKSAVHAGVTAPFIDVKPHTDKLGRIQSLQPQLLAGRIQFCRKHSVLLEELRQFPFGSHDDGLDGLQMAIALTRYVKAAYITCSR